MTIVNAAVGMLLRSPLHAVLSGSTALIRYTARRSGRTITTTTNRLPVTAQAVIGGDDPARAASLLGDYSVSSHAS